MYEMFAGERAFSCPQCNQAFKTKSNYQRHMKMHEGKKTYSCGDCAMKGTDYGTFQRANMKASVISRMWGGDAVSRVTI